LCNAHIKNDNAPENATAEISVKACGPGDFGTQTCSEKQITKITSVNQYNTVRSVSKAENKLRAHQGNHTLGR
jgi:hypothetical protein